jgi:hypothetical protein
MFYFRFDIPVNADGTTVSYSPGWCGTREQCALNEKGIYYNDKERWGIGIAEGKFVPPDVEVVDANKVAELMGITLTTAVAAEAPIEMDAEGVLKIDSKTVELPEITDEKVFYGTKLRDRYLPQAVAAELAIIPEGEEKSVDYFEGDPYELNWPAEPIILTNTMKFCPECHKVVARIIGFDNGTIEVWQGGRKVISGLKAANIMLGCPSGHKVKVALGS